MARRAPRRRPRPPGPATPPPSPPWGIRRVTRFAARLTVLDRQRRCWLRAAPDRRPRTADQAPEEVVLAPPRRPASAGAPPSHPPARTSAVSNRIRARSACEAPPSFFSFSSPRRTRLVPRRAPGPSARFSVCAGGPALYIVAPPNARAGAWPVGARKCTDLIYWILCRPWSCLAAAECIR